MIDAKHVQALLLINGKCESDKKQSNGEIIKYRLFVSERFITPQTVSNYSITAKSGFVEDW